MPTNETLPLLRIGRFGTHIIKAPSDRYTFIGTVPSPLASWTFDSEEKAITAFVKFFRTLPAADQKTHAGNLREDILKLIQEEN